MRLWEVARLNLVARCGVLLPRNLIKTCICVSQGVQLCVCVCMCLCMCTAVYLCKRTMQNKQRLELADYEAENLARLQKTFSRKWEFIFMQAEAQAK